MPSWSPSTQYEAIRDQAKLWKLAREGLENKTLKVGDYVDWADQFINNDIFSTNLSNIQSLFADFNKQLVNITGNVYQVQSL